MIWLFCIIGQQPFLPSFREAIFIQFLWQLLNSNVVEWYVGNITNKNCCALIIFYLQRQAIGWVWPLGSSWLVPDIHWHIISLLSSVRSKLGIGINLNKAANENELTNNANLGTCKEHEFVLLAHLCQNLLPISLLTGFLRPYFNLLDL